MRIGKRVQTKFAQWLQARSSWRIPRSTITKVLLVTGLMALVTVIPFIVSPGVSNAYAPSTGLGMHQLDSENSMPIYVASAENPTVAFQYTGMTLSLRTIPGSYGRQSIYDYLHINPSQTSNIPVGGLVGEQSLNLWSTSSSLFLFASNNAGSTFGTVGADIQHSASGPTLDQYVNVNYGGPVSLSSRWPSGQCNTGGDKLTSVDTGGAELYGVNLVVTGSSRSITYAIAGGLVLYHSNGEADLIVLINPEHVSWFAFNSQCNDPTLSFSSSVIHWSIRAPPPSNTVPGNYQLYPAIGSGGVRYGRSVLIFQQEINGGSGSTSTSTTTTSTSTDSTTQTSSSIDSTSSSSSTTSSSTTMSSTSTTSTSISSSTSSSSSSTGGTSTTTTSSSSSTTTCTIPQCENPYWNPNSQKVATYVATQLFNPQVGLIATSALQGCVDYVGGLPCSDTFWTTSDNVPTGWTLQDFGYSSVTQAIINECNYLKCSSANSGDRYEAYVGSPIAIGSPGDIHGIFSPGSSAIALTCSTSGCGDGTAVYGTLSNGVPYKIQADVWTGSAGSPNDNAAVDVVGPQAINYYIHGDLTDSMKYANALVSLWNGYSVDGSGGGDTWHLGQVMFVMRVLGLDTSTNTITTAYGTETYAQVFQQMENELWAIQSSFNCSGGCLPNSYTQSSPSGPIVGTGGVDAENQDAALLPFSYSVVSMVRADFGAYSMPGNPHPVGSKTTPDIRSSSISPILLVAALLSVVLSASATPVALPKFSRSKEMGVSTSRLK